MSVWRFFGLKKSDVDQTTILCKCCRAKVIAGGGNTGMSQGQFPPELSRKRHGSEAAVFRTAIPTRSGTDTFRLTAQDVHNYNCMILFMSYNQPLHNIYTSSTT